MNVKDSISATMDSIEGNESGDQSAKNIFSYKPIMGNILKYTVAEYKKCSLEEITDCIEGDTIQTGTALGEDLSSDSFFYVIHCYRNTVFYIPEFLLTLDIIFA